MKATFVIVSVSDRWEQLDALIANIRSFKKFDEYDICVLYQDYLNNVRQIKNVSMCKEFIVATERLGCHGARVELLRRVKYDFYINLDDDMELTEYTDYTLPLYKCSKKTTGFVLTNWARSQSLMDAKVPKMENRFVKQILVYQGGGMVYNDKIAEIMRGLPAVKAVFDDIWPISAYINGYTNYRYLGSLAIHRICTKGGMASFMADNDLPLLGEDYINYRFIKGKTRRNVHIPLDADVNAHARKLHADKERELFKSV